MFPLIIPLILVVEGRAEVEHWFRFELCVISLNVLNKTLSGCQVPTQDSLSLTPLLDRGEKIYEKTCGSK